MWFCERIHGLKIEEIVINFLPSWWYEHYGIEYGKRMYFDPDYRLDAYMNMKKFYYERYGKDTNSGTNDPVPIVIQPDFDNTFYQNMLGLDVMYYKDQYPMGVSFLPEEKIMKLEPPENLWDVYPYTEVRTQVKYMNEKLDKDEIPFMKTRGVLNEAIQICSTDFYGYLLDEDYEDEVSHVLQYVQEIIKQQIRRNGQANPRFMHIMMNCTCGIAGAPAYEKTVYQYDKGLYDYCLSKGMPIGLHHCGNFDKFVEIYGNFKNLQYIEVGHESKIRPVLDQFPKAHIVYIISTNLVNFGTPGEIKDKLNAVLEETQGDWDRFSIQVPDLDASIPDDNVVTIIETLKR